MRKTLRHSGNDLRRLPIITPRFLRSSVTGRFLVVNSARRSGALQNRPFWSAHLPGQIRLKSVIVCSQNSGSASSVERFRPRRNSLVDFGRSPPKVESSAPLRILRVLGPACPVWSGQSERAVFLFLRRVWKPIRIYQWNSPHVFECICFLGIRESHSHVFFSST